MTVEQQIFDKENSKKNEDISFRLRLAHKLLCLYMLMLESQLKGGLMKINQKRRTNKGVIEKGCVSQCVPLVGGEGRESKNQTEPCQGGT